MADRLPASTLTRDLVFAAIYVVQGTLYGFVGFILVPTMSANGVSLEAQTGIWTLAGAPWLLKLVWAPLVDRHPGRRRVILSIALLGVAAGLASLALGDPRARDVGFVALVWLLINVVLTLGDVAVDAIALEIVAPNERGRTQGFMLGGHHLGLEGLGGVGLGVIVAATDLAMAIWLQAALALLVAACVWHMPVRTANVVSSPRPPLWALMSDLLRRPRARLVLGIAALILFADVLTSSVSGHFWVQRLGWTPEKVAEQLPLVLLVANLAGYVCAGALVDRLGPARAGTIGSAALGASWIAFSLLESFWSSDVFLLAFVAVQAIVTAMLYVGVHAVFMGWADPRARATHFVIFTVLLGVPRIVAPMVGAWTVSLWGFAGVFFACGLYQLAMAGLLARAGSSETHA